MNPTIKKLPKGVQSLICASNQINSYTKAVQELMFNALDADATSIAVRIHIAEGSIQIVDNGCGISKADFKSIGQNYMTSKLVDISTLKSAPNKYGFQGQSLANLAQISQILKIISRYNQCETTCVKTFENGTAKSTTKCSPRPSKGTTIEIKGFLYNLSIQKKSVDLLNELQSIKTFLEHISLVHSSISLSLRDDSKNEIVYKIHKNRDVYQTLSALYEIEKSNLQELRVEKNEYKVKAYVGKHSVDMNRRFIFLNGKFVHDSSPLHRKVNDNFKKHLKAGKKKIKKNINNYEDILILANQIPFYFMFITCPYMDYEMTNTVLEFKDWEQINILLDKLVKFSIGGMQVKAAQSNAITGLNNKQATERTRNQIENIMQKILGSHSKKPAISQMQNGVKGKLIKRKPKIKNKALGSLKVVNSKQSIDKKKRSKQDKNNIYEQTASKDSILKTRLKPEIFGYDKRLLFLTTSNEKHAEKPSKIKILKKPNHKPAISSEMKKQKQINRTNHGTRTQSKFYVKKKVSLNDMFAMETESVKRKCELLAQKTEGLMNCNDGIPEVFINENVHYTSSNFIQNNKNIEIRKKINEIVIHEYLPLSPKFNIWKQGNNTNKKPFNSNYDLLQTIINGQESRRDKQKGKMNNYTHDESLNMDKPDNCLPINEGLDNIPSLFELAKSDHVSLVRELNDPPPFSTMTSNYNFRRAGNRSPFLSITHNSNRIPLVKEVDDVSQFQEKTLDSNIMPYLVRNSENGSPFPAATFQSHNYYFNQDLHTENDVQANNYRKKPRNFISTESRKNFTLQSGQHNNIFLKSTQKRKLNRGCYKHFQPYKRNLNKTTKMLDKETKTIKGIPESYTIEFTESNKYAYDTKNNACRHNMIYSVDGIETLTPSMSYIFNDSYYDCVSPMDPKTWVFSKNESEKYNELDYEPINKNTLTILNSLYRESNIQEYFNSKHSNNHETYSIEKTTENLNEPYWESETFNDNINKNNTNFVSVSKSQENIVETLITNPIDVCETVINDLELSTDTLREFNISFNYRHKNYTDFNENSNNASEIADLQQRTKNVSELHFSSVDAIENKVNDTSQHQQKSRIQDHSDEISHHFTMPDCNINVENSPILFDSIARAHNEKTTSNKQNKDTIIVNDSDNVNGMNSMGAFNLRNRLCFVPKGMSPIFKECQTKPDLGYDTIKEDYYEDKIYGNFMEKIQNDTEIFKPRIQEASNLSTKDISKVNNKLNKDKAFLKFDGLSIKNANVLGQVDTKFIVATMKGNDHKTEAEEFLVLFDQHAVHERIRLENNLADYLIGSQWKSVAIDEVSLKISRDEILYLHNYREKFTQFGLEWTILNYHEISISAIPEAILGKNPRQVDKIIKAVKNLITEEIFMIQTQRGCVSLQPKSIMDLVFSEACRYAIKFGDHLSKSQCVELLKGLSDCKTPFQCAHGRPVMAVIMNMESNNVDYKIDFDLLKQFKK